MTAAKIAAAIAVVSLFGHCQAQEFSPLQPINTTSVATAQLSSVRNYSLLKPINKSPKVVRKTLSTTTGGLLQPLAQDASPGDFDRVVVTPQSFQRGVFDKHEFLVRNNGVQPVNNAKVLLTAPVDSVVHQVVPKPDSVKGLDIELTIGDIAPGEEKLIEVSIKYPRNELARFRTKVVSGGLVASENKIASKAVQPVGQSLGPRTSGMLKPKVPATTVSATTIRFESATENEGVQSVKPSAGEVVPQAMNVLKPLEPQIKSGASVQDAEVGVSQSATAAVSIEASLRGPDSAVVGNEVEFSIDVRNLSEFDANSVIVQLSIPEELKVTILDRSAWHDGENRKLTWEVKGLKRGAVETIRYKAIVKTECSIEQEVVTGMDNQFQCRSLMRTTVAK